jgi:hypothetical protein
MKKENHLGPQNIMIAPRTATREPIISNLSGLFLSNTIPHIFLN